MDDNRTHIRRSTTTGMICFDSLFQWTMHLLHFYHSQYAGWTSQEIWGFIKDSVNSVYQFWTANPDHGPVCSSQ